MKIADDKQKHIMAGMIAGLSALVILGGLVYMIPAAFAAGLIKEWYDVNRTGFDWRDILATTIGGGVAFLIGLVPIIFRVIF